MSSIFADSVLAGERALVTGASRGIGAAIAAALAAAGAQVAGTATSASGAERISDALSKYDGDHRGYVLDVADAASVDALVKEFGKATPTILINNAGITRDNLLMRMSADEWNDIINTNLSGVYRLSKACLRGMLKNRGGRMINIASVVGVMGNAGQSNYAAAKAGVIGFSKSLAKEVGSRGVTVNVIAPGFIETDMTDALGEEQKTQLLAQVPLAKLGKVDDIAAAVVYLCSSAGSYITGETLHINGGMWVV